MKTPLPSEALRRRQAADLDAMLPAFVARLRWPAARLRAVRVQALRALLLAARERSPWHRQRLAGIDLGTFTDADVERLPVMTKTDLMDHFDEIVTDDRLTLDRCEAHLAGLTGDAYLLDEYHVVASGGSSGRRGVFVFGWDAWVTCYASVIRPQLDDWMADPALAGVPRVAGVVAASKPTHISSAFGLTFSTPGQSRHLFPVSQPLDRIVSGLNELQPTLLTGYSSYLPRLAREAEAGRLRITPRRVVAISEPLLPEARAALEAAFGVPVLNNYGMSEGVFAGPCRRGGLHLPDDICLVEPVSGDGRPVAPGVTSHHTYVTVLYNPVLPLIRYEVSDELTPLDACPCGSAFARIADPQGRLDDAFTYAAGATVHPHVFRSVLGRRADIIEYQVRQTPRGADVDVVTRSGVVDADIGPSLAEGLAAVGVDEPEVTVTAVGSLDRLATGKLRRFVPLS